jgi:hypothetical protein
VFAEANFIPCYVHVFYFGPFYCSEEDPVLLDLVVLLLRLVQPFSLSPPDGVAAEAVS